MFAALHYDSYDEIVGYQQEGYIRPISGKVLLDGPGQPAGGNVAGEFSSVAVNRISALRDGENLSELLAGLGRELSDVHEAIFERRSRRCRAEVRALWEVPPRASDLLLIQRLSIYARFRGQGLGLAALWQLMRAHSAGAGIVAIQACPLQFCSLREDEKGREWAGRMELDRFAGVPLAVATAKVARHYRQLGFVPYGTTGLLLFNTRYELPLPEAVRRWVVPCSEAA